SSSTGSASASLTLTETTAGLTRSTMSANEAGPAAACAVVAAAETGTSVVSNAAPPRAASATAPRSAARREYEGRTKGIKGSQGPISLRANDNPSASERE